MTIFGFLIRPAGVVLAALALLFAAGAHAQPQVYRDGINGLEHLFGETDDGSYVHLASGYAYPPMLGDMPRRKIIVYGPGDVSVQYTLRGGGNGDSWFDLYVYSAHLTLEEETRSVERDMARNMNISPIAAPAPSPAAAGDGASGWFRGTLGGRPMTTAYFLVMRGNWFVKVRASSPDEAGASGITRLVEAIDQIDWAWSPGAATVQPELQAVHLDGRQPSTHIDYKAWLPSASLE